MESVLETAKQGWDLDTAQKGPSITGNVLLETYLCPSVLVLRVYPFPEVWLPGLGASLEIAQSREVPLLLATLDRALQTALWGGLCRGWLPFPTQAAFKLSHYHLSPTWATDPAVLQPWLRLAISPADSCPDPDMQADFLAWPRPCLITMALPGDCWAVPYPGCPGQTCPARLAQALQSCTLPSKALPSAGLVTMLSFWLTFHCRAAGPRCSPTLLLIETVWQTNCKVMQDANFL